MNAIAHSLSLAKRIEVEKDEPQNTVAIVEMFGEEITNNYLVPSDSGRLLTYYPREHVSIIKILKKISL